jgi:malate dehydrogenase (oxaloacetate-decarboxylating)
LDYGKESILRHRQFKGKIAIVSKMPLETMDDLSIAYTPGVAAVSMEIAGDSALSYELTNRANTVAVVTDGSAVLGLGDIGPEAAMPVMEGKAVLFGALADIDAVPICLATQDVDEIVRAVELMAPSFGGINLEDISAPRCFEIEDRLQNLGIPVFHDDQHGTAVVTLAALINSARVTGRRLEDLKVVFSGAGAAGIATARLLHEAGARDLLLVDSKGLVHSGRTDLTPIKKDILKITNPDGISGSLGDALVGADVFIGVSKAGIVKPEMVRAMAPNPIVLPMANPVPEIMPDLAAEAGAAIVGTGRSDFPNQINNVLAFPGIFRGALDARAPRVTTGMKLAAAEALAGLVTDPWKDHILPSALDEKVAPVVADAVKRACPQK